MQFMNINKVYKTTHSWGHPVAFNFQTSLQNTSSRWGNCKSSYPGFCYIKMCLKIECIPSYSLNVSAFFFSKLMINQLFQRIQRYSIFKLQLIHLEATLLMTSPDDFGKNGFEDCCFFGANLSLDGGWWRESMIRWWNISYCIIGIIC